MSTKPDKPTTSVTEADTSSALDLEELEAVQGGHHQFGTSVPLGDAVPASASPS